MTKKLFAILLIFFTACVAQDFPSVSAQDAYKMKSENDSLVFVDVRTVAEFTGPLGHIDGAVLIPLHDLQENIDKLNAYKDRQIIVYCRSGNRSKEGTRILKENGFKAINMLGGIKAWNNLPQMKKE